MQRKSRILYLVGQLGAGGLERQLFYLLQTIDRKSYSPVVVVWNYKEGDLYVSLIRDLGIQVVALPQGQSGFYKIFAFLQLLKLLKPEVIHSYCFYTNFAAFVGGAVSRAISIGAIRSDFLMEKKKTGIVLGRLCARWPTVHISNNVMAVKNIQNTRGIFVPQKLFVVRNGMDLEKFKFEELSKFKRPKILAVGSLLPVKRWDRLIKAAAGLKKNGCDFLVRIVGDGPLFNPLRNEVERLNLLDSVMLLGHRNDIPDLLAESCFLVHASDYEGCPNVILEAMACGRAVVATNVGDIPFLIDDGKSGFLVDKEDEIGFLEKMMVLLKDENLCRQMGNLGRAKAEREFGLKRMISETLGVYRTAGWKG
ncbi:MAG: glycosyltransferase family 4 protein [Nitrospira sp.]|nr:glycosyltransferase family 4 protein [Nitrospira sp.]